MTQIKIHVSYAELKPIAPILQICEQQRLAGFPFTGVPSSFTESGGFPGHGRVVTSTGTIEVQQDQDGQGAWFTYTPAPEAPATKRSALDTVAEAMQGSLKAQMYEALKAQHDAIDRLFARLTQLDDGFYPSRSGQPWEALVQGNLAITRYKTEEEQ